MLQKQISLLRAINVSGKNKIKMEELKTLYLDLGFKNVKTYIQSGNVIFESSENVDTNKEHIRKNIKESFGLDVEIIVFKVDKLKDILEKNLFFKKDYDKSALYYCFLSSTIENNNLDEIKSKATLNEEVYLDGDILYLYYPNGMGKSKVTNNLIESKLKIYSTIRNHNTIVKLKELSDC